VYWARRTLVLAVAVLLVVGVAKLLGSTTGGDGGGPASAQVVGAEESSGSTPSEFSLSPAVPSAIASPHASAGTARPAEPTRTPLAQPTGPCADEDVVVTPRVDEAHAGGDVTIALDVTTLTSAACTFTVSPESVAVKITSGADRIWTSQECPSAIPTEDVVPRRNRADTVNVVWSGRRSDSECSRTTQWALRGWYHAEAVALGAETPVDVQFELTAPPTRFVTPSPSPTPTSKATPKASQKPTEQPTEQPTEKPSEKPAEKPAAAPTQQPTASPSGRSDR
jgi:hypothetical protein